jgi:hypothetical protein
MPSRHSSGVNEHLMHALLYATLFLGTSTEDVCDRDLAVKQLEGIAWSLRQMTAEAQECFRYYAYRIAREHPVVAVGVRSGGWWTAYCPSIEDTTA